MTQYIAFTRSEQKRAGVLVKQAPALLRSHLQSIVRPMQQEPRTTTDQVKKMILVRNIALFMVAFSLIQRPTRTAVRSLSSYSRVASCHHRCSRSLVLSPHEATSRLSLDCPTLWRRLTTTCTSTTTSISTACLASIIYLGVPVHPATWQGQPQDVQNMCSAPSTTAILADSAGKVECQGDGNCDFYSTLNGMNLNANKVR